MRCGVGLVAPAWSLRAAAEQATTSAQAPRVRSTSQVRRPSGTATPLVHAQSIAVGLASRLRSSRALPDRAAPRGLRAPVAVGPRGGRRGWSAGPRGDELLLLVVEAAASGRGRRVARREVRDR